MISKELLSEVLKKEITEINIDIYGNIDYKIIDDYGSNINIYELAHKCKEWAIKNGYNIWSSAYSKECYIEGRTFVNTENIRFLEGSEPKAIFKACEWILNIKD